MASEPPRWPVNSDAPAHGSHDSSGGEGLLLLGVALAVASFVSPWIHLSVNMGGLREERGYSPWDVVRLFGADAPAFVACLLLAYVVMVAGGAALLLCQDVSVRAALVALCLPMALLCFIATLLFMVVYPEGVALSFPYPKADFEFGIWLALAGLACITLGTLGMPLSSRSGDEPDN